MSQNGHHTSRQRQKTQRRNRLIVLAVALGLGAFAVGFAVANLTGGADDATVSSPTPSAIITPSPSGSPSGDPSPTASANPDTLEDGQHLVMVTDGGEQDGRPAVRFDLAIFMTGADAQAYASSHGIDKLTNDYLIVNDNPRLRWMPLAAEAKIRSIPVGTCCKLRKSTVDGFLAAATGSAMTDYPDMHTTWWWITVSGGLITRIDQQYLP